MYRLKAYRNGQEYQALAHDFKSAVKVLKKNKKHMAAITIQDESGLILIAYIKNLGESL